MRNLFFILASFILLTSCGGGSSSNEKSTKSTKPTKPCSFLTEAEIKEVLSLPEDAPTTMEDVVYTYPTCSYEWETLIYEKPTTISGQDMVLEYPYTLMIVTVANANKSMYEKSIVVYKDGENVSGLGEMAMWGDSMSQVTFLSDGYMIHLSLKVSADNKDNKDKAIELAKLVKERL